MKPQIDCFFKNCKHVTEPDYLQTLSDKSGFPREDWKAFFEGIVHAFCDDVEYPTLHKVIKNDTILPHRTYFTCLIQNNFEFRLSYSESENYIFQVKKIDSTFATYADFLINSLYET